MPELPDVEVVARRLRPRLVGRRIEGLAYLAPPTPAGRLAVRSPDREAFARQVRGRRVVWVGRRGKYLLLSLEGGGVLAVHLRMTGDLTVAPRREPRPPHTRLALALDGGEELRFVDQRRFGHVDLLPDGRVQASLGPLGLEPLGRAFTPARLRALLRGRRGALKPLLLRQDLIAGIGNIYADEILFQARLHPARRVEQLGPAEIRRLHQAIRRVLGRAVRAGMREGEPAGDLLRVRDRAGSCPRCRGRLAVVRLGGRGTVFCPRCQPPAAVSVPRRRGMESRGGR